MGSVSDEELDSAKQDVLSFFKLIQDMVPSLKTMYDTKPKDMSNLFENAMWLSGITN
jgi:hypothetical protein